MKNHIALATPQALTKAGLCLISAAVSACYAAETVVVDEPVVVTATRIAQPVSQAAASISVVTSKDIEELEPNTFAETLLSIPNVDVTSPDSVMFSRISIRGSDANQITYLIDGMRQDDTTTGGNQFIGIFADPEMLKQIEVKRGGGSALYGNGGIGGTISVTTKNASDFLAGTDKDYGMLLKTGYSTDTQTWQKGLYAFGRHDFWDVVVGVNRRDSGEVRASRGYRSDNNADGDYTAVLAKVSAAPIDDMLLSLSYNYDIANDAWDTTSYGRNTYKNKQHRLTGSWEYAYSDLINIKSAVQYVKSQYSFDSGATQAKNDFDSLGGNIQNTSEFVVLGNHALTFGGDIYKKTQKGQTFGANGWEYEPGRPDSEALDAGLFIQDVYEINLYVSLTPVLRWNYYKRESNKGFPSISDSKLTPGLTLTLRPVESAEIWASVNSGYRPPVLDELYFTMVWPGYIDTAIVVANPDLKPERSTNWEIGTNLNFSGLLSENDKLNTKLTFFYDDVKDFISSASWQSDTPNTTYFTAVNHGHVIRKGIELSANYAIDNFSVKATYGLVHASDKETDARVEGITPQSANLRLGYAIAQHNLDLWYRAHWSKGGKSNEETAWQSGIFRDYSGYMTHAVGLEWSPKIAGFVNFNAGIAITNIFDKEYQMLNGSYGYGRGARVWLSAQF